MKVGHYNKGHLAITRSVLDYPVTVRDDIYELEGNNGKDKYEPCRLWLGYIWSTKTYCSDHFMPIRYDNISEDIIQQWKLLDIGAIVYTVKPVFNRYQGVYIPETGEKILRLTKAYHLHTMSIYETEQLLYHPTLDGYIWQRSAPIRYGEITNRKPEFTDEQYMKLMEANLRE